MVKSQIQRCARFEAGMHVCVYACVYVCIYAFKDWWSNLEFNDVLGLKHVCMCMYVCMHAFRTFVLCVNSSDLIDFCVQLCAWFEACMHVCMGMPTYIHTYIHTAMEATGVFIYI